MNIVLFGLRCVGKTSVGTKLSDITDKIFFDTDRLIEKRESKSIPEIVSDRGWDYFRKKEKEVIKDVSKENNAVISVGGGALMDTENVDLLKDAFLVLLKADIKTMESRMAKDNSRPPLTSEDTHSEIREIIEKRMPTYEKIASIIVDTTGLKVDNVCDKIMFELEERSLLK